MSKFFTPKAFEMEMSGSNSKKRKICSEAEEDDEAKMEKFSALVRRIRETRDRWFNLRSGEKSMNHRVEVWKPTFQVEDFAEVKPQCGKQEASPSPLLNAAFHTNNSAKKEEADKGIDLTLAL